MDRYKWGKAREEHIKILERQRDDERATVSRLEKEKTELEKNSAPAMVKQLKEVGEGAEILAKRFEKEKAQLEKENSERAEDVARLEKEKADLQARIDGIGEERDEEKRQLEELLREVGKAATAAR